MIIFIIMLGVGGKHLTNAPATAPVTAKSVITFATTTASSVISWCTMTPDYGVYHNQKTSRQANMTLLAHYADPVLSSLRIFIYTYLGFFTASVRLHPALPYLLA